MTTVTATRRARAARRRGPRGPRRPGRGVLAVLGAFLLICGLLLLWISPDRGSSVEEEVSLDREQAMRALDSTQRAERAMDVNNYGEARVHLREARQTLAGLLHEAKDEAAEDE